MKNKINAPVPCEKKIDRAARKEINTQLHAERCAAFANIKARMCQKPGTTKADRKADNQRIWAEVVAASLVA